MYECMFRNLEKGYNFTKTFNSPYLMRKFLTKVRYSKRIRFLGSVKLWG